MLPHPRGRGGRNHYSYYSCFCYQRTAKKPPPVRLLLEVLQEVLQDVSILILLMPLNRYQTHTDAIYKRRMSTGTCQHCLVGCRSSSLQVILQVEVVSARRTASSAYAVRPGRSQAFLALLRDPT